MRHQCMIYDGAPSTPLPEIAAIAAEKLKEGHRCLFLNSPPMVAGFRSFLASEGVDVAAEVARGALVLSSSQEHLADGVFDGGAMLASLKTALEDALRDGYAGLWATGDMMWELGNARNFIGLLDYERGLEALLQENRQLSGICQYRRDGLPADAVREALQTHPAVFINSTLSRLNPFYLQPSEVQRAAEAGDMPPQDLLAGPRE